MNIEYKINFEITPDQFIDLLNESTLGERRPVGNRECIKGMLDNANLLVTAWHDDSLLGVARSLTDFHYACYISDLAVSKPSQHMGMGKNLLVHTQQQLGPECKIILVAAPAANSYYEHLGFTNNQRCWILDRDKNIIS